MNWEILNCVLLRFPPRKPTNLVIDVFCSLVKFKSTSNDVVSVLLMFPAVSFAENKTEYDPANGSVKLVLKVFIPDTWVRLNDTIELFGKVTFAMTDWISILSVTFAPISMDDMLNLKLTNGVTLITEGAVSSAASYPTVTLYRRGVKLIFDVLKST